MWQAKQTNEMMVEAALMLFRRARRSNAQKFVDSCPRRHAHARESDLAMKVLSVKFAYQKLRTIFEQVFQVRDPNGRQQYGQSVGYRPRFRWAV